MKIEVQEGFLPLAADEVVYLLKGLEKRDTHLAGARRAAKDNRQFRMFFFYLRGQIERGQELEETDGKAEQGIAVHLGRRKPLGRALLDAVDQFLEIENSRIFFREALAKELFRPGFHFRKEEWCKERFSGPARAGYVCVGVDADGLGEVQVRMKAVNPAGRFFLHIAFQRRQLEGGPVDERPGHGDEGNPGRGSGSTFHLIGG